MKTQNPKSPSLDSLYRAAQSRRRRQSISRSVAVAGAGLAGAGSAAGCAVDMEAPGDIQSLEQADWVQDEGQRNTEMVSFLDEFWSVCNNPYTRTGCGSVDIFVKVRVKPVPNADLNAKEVGIVYRNPYDYTDRTAFGSYFTTYDNGDEEWHVKVSVPTWRDFFVFNAFYRDGAFNTWYDDNQGEFHVVNDGPATQVVRVQRYASTAKIINGRLQGTLQVRVADLDFDKRLLLRGTCDGWASFVDFASSAGAPGTKNAWMWKSDSYGTEIWEIDLDIACPSGRFEYAVRYDHGVINDALLYQFWDNNFSRNYVIEEEIIEFTESDETEAGAAL